MLRHRRSGFRWPIFSDFRESTVAKETLEDCSEVIGSLDEGESDPRFSGGAVASVKPATTTESIALLIHRAPPRKNEITSQMHYAISADTIIIIIAIYVAINNGAEWEL